jgi:hypothetical protein
MAAEEMDRSASARRCMATPPAPAAQLVLPNDRGSGGRVAPVTSPGPTLALPWSAIWRRGGCVRLAALSTASRVTWSRPGPGEAGNGSPRRPARRSTGLRNYSRENRTRTKFSAWDVVNDLSPTSALDIKGYLRLSVSTPRIPVLFLRYRSSSSALTGLVLQFSTCKGWPAWRSRGAEIGLRAASPSYHDMASF